MTTLGASGGRRHTQALWIDWGRHLRTHTLTRKLEVDLVEVCYGGGRLWRYIRSAIRTTTVLHSRRPRVVIATIPSIVLGYFLLLLRLVYGFRLVSDAHFAGVKSFGTQPMKQWLLNFYNKRVDFVIVPCLDHAAFLNKLGARTFICPDPLPEMPRCSTPTLRLPEKSVFLICSFAADEPYMTVFEAFKGLREKGYSLYVSGNAAKASLSISHFPWVEFLGFLPAEAYYEYLRSCSIVMDLTVNEGCLVCGAYEALALQRPLVLSNTRTLREYFGDACILTENTHAGIAESVEEAWEHQDQLVESAKSWVILNDSYMERTIENLQVELFDGIGARK